MPKKDDPNVVYVTKEGYKKLEEDLEYLKTTRRKEVAARLKEAISYGDLSENSEYEEAKNEQAFVEGRILEVEEQIKHAKIVKAKKTGKVVEIGSKVVLIPIKAKKEGEPEEYILVGSTEADPLASKISNLSPVGSAIMDHKVGDVVEFKVPAGKMSYKIKKIS